MKTSIRELIDCCLNVTEDGLIYLDVHWGISTSGLLLSISIVDWIISRLLREKCNLTLEPYPKPFAFYWAAHNALKSHHARPWKPEWIDPRIPF